MNVDMLKSEEENMKLHNGGSKVRFINFIIILNSSLPEILL